MKTSRSILVSMKAPMDDFMLQANQAVDVVDQNPAFGVLMVRSSALSYARFKDALDGILGLPERKNCAAHNLEMTQRTSALKIRTSISY